MNSTSGLNHVNIILMKQFNTIYLIQYVYVNDEWLNLIQQTSFLYLLKLKVECSTTLIPIVMLGKRITLLEGYWLYFKTKLNYYFFWGKKKKNIHSFTQKNGKKTKQKK